MYKRRILPLFLVFALCTLQLRAEKNPRFYALGAFTLAILGYFGWKLLGGVRQLMGGMQEQAMRARNDFRKLSIARAIRAGISMDDVIVLDFSPEFRTDFSEIQKKLNEKRTIPTL